MLAHALISVAMAFGFSLVIIVGTLSVIQDLFDRAFDQTPLITDDGHDERRSTGETTAPAGNH